MADFNCLKSELEGIGLTCTRSIIKSFNNDREPEILFEVRTLYNKTRTTDACIYYVKIDPDEYRHEHGYVPDFLEGYIYHSSEGFRSILLITIDEVMSNKN